MRNNRKQPVSPRLQSIGTLPLPVHLSTVLRQHGVETVEDLLRWRNEEAVGRWAGDRRESVFPEIDQALNGIGLFRATPLRARNWDIYNGRRRGATFSSLAKTYCLSPAGARVVFFKVKETLEAELKTRALFGGQPATKVQDLPLPTRAKFGLQRANVFTLANLLLTPPEAIIRMRGLGRTSLEAIRDLQLQFMARRGTPV